MFLEKICGVVAIFKSMFFDCLYHVYQLVNDDSVTIVNDIVIHLDGDMYVSTFVSVCVNRKCVEILFN